MQNSKKDAKIYVIDNGSNDNSVNFLKSSFTEINVIELTNNLGFAGGYNEGLKKIDSKYFIIVNSDIEVTPNWISPLVKILENNSNISAVQPKILSHKNKGQFEYAGAAGGFIDRLGYPFCRGRVFDHLELDNGQYDKHSEIFWSSGACMAIKAKDFNNVGGFDEDFFAHMEEIDLCWRLKNLGKSIFYTGESIVYHVGGGTLKYNAPRKTYLNYRNNLWMIHKNYKSNLPLFLFILLRMILDQISGIKLILSGNFNGYFSILKAHFHYLFTLRKTQAKRVKLSKKHFKSLSGYYNNSTIWDYFFLGKKEFSKIFISSQK